MSVADNNLEEFKALSLGNPNKEAVKLPSTEPITKVADDENGGSPGAESVACSTIESKEEFGSTNEKAETTNGDESDAKRIGDWIYYHIDILFNSDAKLKYDSGKRENGKSRIESKEEFGIDLKSGIICILKNKMKAKDLRKLRNNKCYELWRGGKSEIYKARQDKRFTDLLKLSDRCKNRRIEDNDHTIYLYHQCIYSQSECFDCKKNKSILEDPCNWYIFNQNCYIFNGAITEENVRKN